MSDDEKTRLLSGPTTDRGKTNSISLFELKFYYINLINFFTGKERNSKCCIPSIRAWVLICLIVAALVTLILTTFFALKLNHTHTATAQCINGTSSVKMQTRSGSFSLLGNISDPMCSEPVAQVSLSSKDSSLEIHQIFCKDMNVLPFQAGPINFSDVLLANEPKPVFNENFSPHTFFMDGSIQVILTNVTTNRSSTTVEACYLTNNNDYSRFLIAGVNWRNYTTGAYCNSTMITVDNGINYEVLLNISKPSFVFLGITSTTAVHNYRSNGGQCLWT